jgi:Ca-activated chloride channel family protein
MAAKPEGREKMAIAKEKLTGLIKALPDTTNLGLAVYGHRRKGDCDDIETLVPVGQGNKATLIQRLQAITPKGKTPITRALERGLCRAGYLRGRHDHRPGQ